MHCLKFTRHYYTPIHFKRIAEKYLLNLLNVCRPNFTVNHIFYQDYVPYNERGKPKSTEIFLSQIKIRGSFKKKWTFAKKKILVFKTSLYI